ncbi:hypothetical protein [Roseibium alexandrii]|uniref:hypothetical protein n=1 Tax=Roseibium alexandrii TaxID=388408 RepID=UPI003752BAF2
MVEIFKNDTEATATDLGTLAFASNLPTDVIAKTNIWTFDHVFSVIDPPISGDIYDYYSFDPYQLASVRVNFTANSTGDYANLVTVIPVQGVSKIEGRLSGVWTGGEHVSSPYEIAGETFIDNNLDVFKAANPQIDTTALSWGRDEFPDSEAIWYLTGETVILEVTGFEFDGTTDQIIANGNNPEQVDYRLAINPHVGDIPDVTLPVDTPDADNSPYEVYRFFNTLTGSHFFTTSTTERDSIITNTPTMTYEGNVFDSNATAENGGSAVYRFYNTATGTHFYTANAEEAANISSNLPHFNDEGIVYYAHSAGDSGGTALYRFYNTSNDSHFFTTSVTERDNIISTLGHYNYEGVAYYVDLA